MSEQTVLSAINFDPYEDVILSAQSSLIAAMGGDSPPFEYLNIMVTKPDRDMIRELKAKTRLSEGLIVREIFSQWREMMLKLD